MGPPTLVALARRLLVEQGYSALDVERLATIARMDVRTVRRAFPRHLDLALAAVTGHLCSPSDPPPRSLDQWRAEVRRRADSTIVPLAAFVRGCPGDDPTLDEILRRLVTPTRRVLDHAIVDALPHQLDELCTATWAEEVTAAARRGAIGHGDASRIVDRMCGERST